MIVNNSFCFQVDLLGIISETSDAATSKQNSNDSNFVNDIFQTNSLSSNGNDSTNQKYFILRYDIYKRNVVIHCVSAIPPMRVLERNGLHIVFYFERQNEMLLIYLEAKNSNPMPLTNFIFRAAVPKVCEEIQKRTKKFSEFSIIYFYLIDIELGAGTTKHNYCRSEQ